MVYDCGGYATKKGIRCSDGRIILENAFSDNDGQEVPVVWQHQRNEPGNVLGHALLENRSDGVYAYIKFNDTENGQTAKSLVEHGDIQSLSIFANGLTESRKKEVMHGNIREVSLVIAGANPGARIDKIYVEHSDGSADEVLDEGIITMGLNLDGPGEFEHADEGNGSGSDDESIEDIFNGLTDKQKKAVYAIVGLALEEANGGEAQHSADDVDEDSTIEEIFNTLTDVQKKAVYAVIGYATDDSDEDEEDVEHSDEEGGTTMSHSIFEGNDPHNTHELSHEETVNVFKNGQRLGSLRAAVEDACLEHGITSIDILFPEAKAVTPTPEMIMRNQDWVSKVWNGVRKSPFSRLKSVYADITGDEARARGYIKGKKKIEEQFGLLKRTTTPQTVYKKQGLDRDDIIDIVDFDVVAWLKAEMRVMLNEELARAVLIGDGRSNSAEDKIQEEHIRPIYTDADMYVIRKTVEFGSDVTNESKTDAIVEAANRARKDYKGAGGPTLFTDSETLTTMLLAKDKIGRKLYNTTTELAAALRVSDIVEVPVMEGMTRTTTPESGGTAKTMGLLGIIVNLKDYTIGADKGGAVSMFDDFDIDYNKQKYLIETRCSGALTVPYSAIVLEYEVKTTTGGGSGTGTEVAG